MKRSVFYKNGNVTCFLTRIISVVGLRRVAPGLPPHPLLTLLIKYPTLLHSYPPLFAQHKESIPSL
eukprot:316000-Hanusia_phi.AAC.2